MQPFSLFLKHGTGVICVSSKISEEAQLALAQGNTSAFEAVLVFARACEQVCDVVQRDHIQDEPFTCPIPWIIV